MINFYTKHDTHRSKYSTHSEYGAPRGRCFGVFPLLLHLVRLDEGNCRHDDVIKWKHFPRNWPFVRGIHRSPQWDAGPLIRYLRSPTFGCINEVKPFLPQHKETWSAKFIRIYGADFDTNRPSNPNEIVPALGSHALVFDIYKYLTPGINSLNWTWYYRKIMPLPPKSTHSFYIYPVHYGKSIWKKKWPWYYT